MQYHLLLLFLLLGFRSAPAQTIPTSVSARFQAMLNNYYEEYLRLNPRRASIRGDYRYNDRLENPMSQPYRDQMRSLYSRYLDSLQVYAGQKLSLHDQLSYQIFRYDLETNLQAMQYPDYLTPLHLLNDFRVQFAQMASGSSVHPFKTVKDYGDFLKRIPDFVALTDTAIANLRKGMAQKRVHPRVIIEKVIPQLTGLLVQDITQSLFYKPVNNMPASFSADDKQRLTGAYTNAIRQQVYPAYTRLLTFLQTEYLPQTRHSVGLLTEQNGKNEYAFLVKAYTTTNLSPDEIFETGKKEVKRIQQTMENIKQHVGFTGDLKSLFTYVTSDPKFFPYQTEEDVVASYQQIYTRMKPHLSKQFNIVPKTAFEIRPIEKYRAASTAAHYMPGTADGSRPGAFYFPVLDAKKYYYWQMEDLFLHEAIPGHHYQIMLQNENPAIPGNQKVGQYGAYVEGWGLYAESLGKDLGLYTDPYQVLGQLQGEIHRAIRLVVDTGIHHKGWTREQAIQYMMDNEPITDQTAVQEIERYIANPGQALSYKIGELKILEMRRKAEKALGKQFDVRAFHDEVLKDGAMPLQIFEAKMDAWIKNQASIVKKN